MRPLRGVVVGGGQMLEIKLASGRIVSVPHTKGVRRWDAVNVHWDYVKGRAVGVSKRDPDAETREVSAEPETLHEEGESFDESSHLGLELSDCPSIGSGESGFWELVLSDGSLAAAGYV